MPDTPKKFTEEIFLSLLTLSFQIIWPIKKKCVFLQRQNPTSTMSREQIISKHKSLFWYTPESEKQNINDALLVERILNDGTLDDYRELIDTLGAKHVAEVFFSAKGRQKLNYYPEIYNFFSHVLKKYA